MQAPDSNITNDKYNESIASMLSLYGIAVSLINDLRVQKLVIIMTTKCSRHNNAILGGFKKLSSDFA